MSGLDGGCLGLKAEMPQVGEDLQRICDRGLRLARHRVEVDTGVWLLLSMQLHRVLRELLR